MRRCSLSRKDKLPKYISAIAHQDFKMADVQAVLQQHDDHGHISMARKESRSRASLRFEVFGFP